MIGGTRLVGWLDVHGHVLGLALVVVLVVGLGGCLGDTGEGATTTPSITPPPTPSATDQPSEPPDASPTVESVDRLESLPADAVKVGPESDPHPPTLHVDGWSDPVPASPTINTAGGEDSPFVLPDGNTLYFWFTPNVSVPARDQVGDGVTGIYVTHREKGEWTEATRVHLGDPDRSLDGCPTVNGELFWFCSARAGNFGGVDVWLGDLDDGTVRNVRNAGERLNADLEIGEFDLSSDGNDLYFGATRPGGQGDLDVWVTHRTEDGWTDPTPVDAVNSPAAEGWPTITEDGTELWFTRWSQGTPAIFRSTSVDGEWSQPELVVSSFASEPTITNDGDVYFVHHYFDNGTMVEADIYVAKRNS